MDHYLTVGIDPGSQGAIVILDCDGAIIDSERMPMLGKEIDTEVLMKILPSFGAIRHTAIGLEEVTPFGMGRTSAFTFGKNVGTLLGVIGAMGFDLLRTRPQKWQKWAFGSGRPWAGSLPEEGSTKEKANAAAISIWPTLEDPLKIKRNQGIADAAMIAAYTRELTMGDFADPPIH